MGSIDKLIEKFKTIPADFKYSDLKKLLGHFGYTEDTGGKTSGSRMQFTNPEFAPIMIHKPHPGSIVKRHALRMVLKTLEEREQIK